MVTPANAGDGSTGVTLLAGEEPGLQVLADSAYASGQVRSELSAAGHDTAIKAIPLGRDPRLGTDQFNRDEFIVAARRAWTNGEPAENYRQWRPMIERSIAWLVHKGNRRVRYRGIERNQHCLNTPVAANLRRLVNLGLDHNKQGWHWPNGPGEITEGPHPTSATGSHPHRQPIGSTIPPTDPRKYAHKPDRETPLLNSVLAMSDTAFATPRDAAYRGPTAFARACWLVRAHRKTPVVGQESLPCAWRQDTAMTAGDAG